MIYLSKLTGESCIAVYPRNFAVTDSFIQLDDEAPHPSVPNRIDSTSWRLCEQDIKELIEGS